ncbi:MAG: hypothetical protein ACE5NC_10500 [Anaerolineae bacterium]
MSPTDRLTLDIDVLVEYLRGGRSAATCLQTGGNIISVSLLMVGDR